mgnify:CR=1 FL=1
MKLRNIILSVAAVALCSTAFADEGMASSNPMNKGGSYLGLAAGWGNINREGGGTQSNSGGFSGRIYTGYLFNASAKWSFGPELGYSFYANNSSTYVDWFGQAIVSKVSANGVDLLLNATYSLNNKMSFSVKPGVQYSFEKDSRTNDGFAEYYNASGIRPEIDLAAQWQITESQPLFLGASYQYVWGNTTANDDGGPTNRDTIIHDRSMLTANLEYMFG